MSLTAVRRNPDNHNAVVLIHGFSGDPHSTFGMLPAFLAGNPHMYGWDIHCFGYPTGLAPDITGVWSSDPDLSLLSKQFIQIMQNEFARYGRLAIVAHSMGGLILQRALLDGPFVQRVSHAICMGTPSAGLAKARLGRLFKQQARDMDPSGSFVTNLRTDWSAKFATPPFEFVAAAGLRDQFVPPRSSQAPFAEQHHAFIDGNHVEMVKPITHESDAVTCIVRRLLGGAEQPSAAATPAHGTIVEQAFTLEMLGKELEAISLLQLHAGSSTDIKGTLAGRFKRRWLRDPDQHWEDGPTAEKLYAEACTEARRKDDHEQAFYLGINVAFMRLALRDDHAGAAEAARHVIEHTAKAPPSSRWRQATEAEARLHLREPAAALALYAASLALLDSRERASMFQQAIWTCRLLGESFVETQLHALMLINT